MEEHLRRATGAARSTRCEKRGKGAEHGAGGGGDVGHAHVQPVRREVDETATREALEPADERFSVVTRADGEGVGRKLIRPVGCGHAAGCLDSMGDLRSWQSRMWIATILAISGMLTLTSC